MRPGGRLGEPRDETGAAALVVEMSAAPLPWLMPTVRALVSDLTARGGFGLDFSSDLRMAVDEACVTLVEHADPDEMLNGRFLLGAACIRVQLRVVPREPHVRLDTAGFGWRILVALVDEVSTQAPGDDGDQLGITLVKRQAPG